MSHFLGLDVGTSAIKAVVLDTGSGTMGSSAKVETPIQYENPTTAVHDPEALMEAIFRCIRQACQGITVEGLGVSCFAEAGIPLDEKGKPLYPIIAWFDQRSEPQVSAFLEKFSERELEWITGQKPAFSFGLFKLLWLKERHPEVIANMRYWLSVHDYILYRMTGEMFTDFTQASRTMLFDQAAAKWSEEILAAVNLSPDMLPKPVPSGTVIGQLTSITAEQTGLPTGLACSAGGHDHLCGMFASGGLHQNRLVDSSGSSQAIMALTQSYQPVKTLFDQDYVHYHHVVPDQYIIKGGLKAVGKAFQWLTRLLHLEETPSLSEKLASGPLLGQKETLLLPFFQGSGTPYRVPFARGSILNLDLNHSSEDIMMAFYEGLGFWLKENLDSLSELTGQDFSSVIAIGGSNQNQDILQIKSNILNLPVLKPEISEPSAVGAALLASIGSGKYRNYQESQSLLSYTATKINPDPVWSAFYNEKYNENYLPAKKAALSLTKFH